MNCSKTTHASLNELLPESVDFIPRAIALEILGISSQQLRRDQDALLIVEVEGFDYNKNDRGFTRKSLEILWKYRQLVKERGVGKALEKIIELTEASNDTGTQGSSRTGKTTAQGWDFGF